MASDNEAAATPLLESQQNGHSNYGYSGEHERNSLNSAHEGEAMIESTNDITLLLGSQQSGYGAMTQISTPNESLDLVKSVSPSTTKSSRKNYNIVGIILALALSLLLIIFQAICFDKWLLKVLVTYFYGARLVYYILFLAATVLPTYFILKKNQSGVSSFQTNLFHYKSRKMCTINK